MQSGDGFREFVEGFSGDGPVPATDAIRMINSQSEEIVESLNGMMSTANSRRQTMVYLLEQCILLGSALATDSAKERIRFRRIRRLVNRARHLATRQ